MPADLQDFWEEGRSLERRDAFSGEARGGAGGYQNDESRKKMEQFHGG